jgi:hypothetical protein
MHLWCKGGLYSLAMCFLERVLPVNRVLLPGERTGLAQAGTASPFGRGGDAGILLFLGQ